MNTTYKCIIVEDEELLAGVLKVYLEHFDELELIGICSNAIEANKLLKEQPVDLMFLDIEMPYMTGIDFLKTLDNPPFVIFTTAYSEHAIDGFDLNAVDYLLKPIKLNRFLVAVNKFLALKTTHNLVQNKLNKQPENTSDIEPKKETINFKCDGNWIRLQYTNITYIEGLREYVRFWTVSGEKYVVLKSLVALENELPNSQFIRIHRSFIVNKQQIKKIVGNQVMIGTKALSVSNSYRKPLFDWFLK